MLVIGDTRFDEFASEPFRECPEKASMQVVFMPTDDPYFYTPGAISKEQKRMKLDDAIAIDEADKKRNASASPDSARLE